MIPTVNHQVSFRPETIRFPRPGTPEPHTGLSRAFLYNLATAGEIETISLRERNKARGVRLIKFDSLMDYIGRAGRSTGDSL